MIVLCHLCGFPEGDFKHNGLNPSAHVFSPTLQSFEHLVDEDLPQQRSIYVIGSMRNPQIPVVAKALRSIGWDAFDDWYSPGEQCDDKWQEYEKARGRTFREALDGHHARHAFELDEKNIERCDAGILVLPAGKSAHIELGVFRGMKKPRYILMNGEPERFDLMYRFATKIFMSIDEMLEALR